MHLLHACAFSSSPSDPNVSSPLLRARRAGAKTRARPCVQTKPGWRIRTAAPGTEALLEDEFRACTFTRAEEAVASGSVEADLHPIHPPRRHHVRISRR